MITKPSEYLPEDDRFRQWGKLVAVDDIDLSKENGYSLGGKWLKWNESVSLVPGKYLICASETGSRASHGYKYALIDGDGNKIEKEQRVAELDAALSDGRITEEQRVNAKNSTLYAFALYISLHRGSE